MASISASTAARRSISPTMGNTASGATEASDSTEKTEQAPPADTKPKKKICCACPDTKKLRDECIVQHGEDACRKWIEAHRQCLRAEEDCLKVPYYRLMHASSNSIAIVSEY
uniref:Cytochrome c oxidase copper chaperone n=1 Tax=Oryza meridionalis TaxID=40149 RepID=A0A0E0ESA8_9ORYZ